MGKFNRTDTSIEGVCIVEPTVFGDNRGYFMETYRKPDFEEIGLKYNFVQDNQSKSKKGEQSAAPHRDRRLCRGRCFLCGFLRYFACRPRAKALYHCYETQRLSLIHI